MIANAGLPHRSSITEGFGSPCVIITQLKCLVHVLVSVDDLDRVVGVNLRGVILCYKHAAKQMIKQGRGGRILG